MRLRGKISGLLNVLMSKSYRRARAYNIRKHKELIRLGKHPRNVEGVSELLGPKIYFTDAKTFVGSYRDIIERGIYQFDSKKKDPYILDCGANIGLSAISFKNQYPQSELVCFEPDPAIFNILKENIESFELQNVTLMNAAVWNKSTTLKFYSEGNESGKLIDKQDDQGMEVRSVRLRDYLERKVDFLKIDIEGAEVAVMLDCADRLKNVNALFVEYHSRMGQKQEVDTLTKILVDSGFRIYMENGGPNSPKPFLEVVPYLDMDMLINIFAIRK